MKKLSARDILDVVLGGVIAVLVSVLLTLVFAIVLKFVNVSDEVIDGVNIAVRIISVVVGCFWAIKSTRYGIAKGLLIGVIYVLTSFLVFGLLAGSLSISTIKLVDFLSGIVTGIISAVVVVNVKKPSTV
ncbi:MAG: TIGR04086 family membrane protein [Christensenellales bacterium]